MVPPAPIIVCISVSFSVKLTGIEQRNLDFG
jgi:hypothetical protein